MSDYTFHCPHCHGLLQADTTMAGSDMRCAHCNQQSVDREPSREEYIDNLTKMVKASIPKSLLFKESMSLWTTLWLFLGVGSAFAIASGRNSE